MRRTALARKAALDWCRRFVFMVVVLVAWVLCSRFLYSGRLCVISDNSFGSYVMVGARLSTRPEEKTRKKVNALTIIAKV